MQELTIDERAQLRMQLAKQEMRDVLFRYCRGVDRMDWDSVRSCFHDDAIDEHGLYSGPIDGFIEFFRRWAGERYRVAMHLLGNVAIAVKGRHAVAESYCVTFLRMSPRSVADPAFQQLLGSAARHVDLASDTSWELTLGLRLVDRFEHRDGKSWRIAHRVVLHEWNRLEPVRVELPLGGLLRNGRRDSNDLIFERLAELAARSPAAAEAP